MRRSEFTSWTNHYQLTPSLSSRCLLLDRTSNCNWPAAEANTSEQSNGQTQQSFDIVRPGTQWHPGPSLMYYPTLQFCHFYDTTHASACECLERRVSETTYNVPSGMYNYTHLLIHPNLENITLPKNQPDTQTLKSSGSSSSS